MSAKKLILIAAMVVGGGVGIYLITKYLREWSLQQGFNIETMNAINAPMDIYNPAAPQVALGGQVWGMGDNTELDCWDRYQWDSGVWQETGHITLASRTYWPTLGQLANWAIWPAGKLTVTHEALAIGKQTGETKSGGIKGPFWRPGEWQTTLEPCWYNGHIGGTTGIQVSRGSTVTIKYTINHRYKGKTFAAFAGLAPRATLGHDWPTNWFFGNFTVGNDPVWKAYTVTFSFTLPTDMATGTYDVYKGVDFTYPPRLTGEAWDWDDDVFVVS